MDASASQDQTVGTPSHIVTPTVAPSVAPGGAQHQNVPLPPPQSTQMAPVNGGGKSASATILIWFESQPTPIILLLISSVGTLILTGFGIWKNPALKIARDESAINKAAVEVAGKAAEASLVSAQAAARNADASVTNANNQGVHSVAHLRQEWINTLRSEIAELVALLTNFRLPAAGENEMDSIARVGRAIAANAILAKVEMLVNPRELPSQYLIWILHRMDTTTITLDQRRWLAKWAIRWSQIILKKEWDRVRNELKGEQPPQVHSRCTRRPYKLLISTEI